MHGFSKMFLFACADYMFSNEHVNYLITYPFDFRNEELLSYYISFVRFVIELVVSCRPMLFINFVFLFYLLLLSFFISDFMALVLQLYLD